MLLPFQQPRLCERGGGVASLLVIGVAALGDPVERLAGAVVVGFAVLVLARDVEEGAEEGAQGRGAGGDDADVELEGAEEGGEGPAGGGWGVSGGNAGWGRGRGTYKVPSRSWT